MARLVPLVEVAQECLAIAGQLEIKDELLKRLNSLEREDVFIFMNEVDGRDLVLDNVPSEHS